MVDELEGLFEGNVVVLTTPIDAAAASSLGARETALVARSVPKRRNEFATARSLARQALARFGVVDFEILHDPDRAPVWPEGIAGSLSHCSTRAFVAVGRRDEVGTLGIDAEDGPGLIRERWPFVLLAAERAFLEGQPAAERERLALVIFSAKESLYKAQYPHTHTLMDFLELRVELARDPGSCFEGTLSCVFERDVGPFAAGTVVPGRFREVVPGGVVVTSAQIRAGAAGSGHSPPRRARPGASS